MDHGHGTLRRVDVLGLALDGYGVYVVHRLPHRSWSKGQLFETLNPHISHGGVLPKQTLACTARLFLSRGAKNKPAWLRIAAGRLSPTAGPASQPPDGT